MVDGVVLVVTELEDVTADLVIEALNERETAVARVDPADIGPGLVFSGRIGPAVSRWGGRLRTASRVIELEQVRSVYYRRPGRWRFDHLDEQAKKFATAEARHGLGGLLTQLPHARYVNHPAATAVADFKIAQLQVAAGLGLVIPATLVTNDLEEAKEFAAEHTSVIYKAFRGLPAGLDGTAGAIWTQRVDPGQFDDSLLVSAHLFQAEVPKVSDARVTVVGSRVFAQQITTVNRDLDWRRGDWEQLAHTTIDVPEPITTALVGYLNHFDLVFGCFDFALTGDSANPDHWVYLETNCNGQWGWLPDADQIAEAFADILSQGRQNPL